jgi:integrase
MGVFQDPNSGKFGIRIKHYGHDFKKIIGFDRREAEIALMEVKREIQIAKLSNQGWEGFAKLQRAQRPVTFAEAADLFLKEQEKSKYSSIRSYRSIFRLYLMPKFGNRTLISLTESDLRAYQNELGSVRSAKGKTLSKSRVNTIMQPLRSILARAFRDGIISRNPAISVSRLRSAKPKIQPFSNDELKLIFHHIDQHYLPFFLTQACTGARPNELSALRWRDINWSNNQIYIGRGRVRGHEGLPKTSAGERYVNITPPVLYALQLAKRQQVVSMDEFVFVNKKGRPIDNHLSDIWANALKRSGLTHRPSYQLRHTFITNAIIEGFHLPYIARIVGHTTIDTLVRHYAGWIDCLTKEQDKKMQNNFPQFGLGDTPKIQNGEPKGELG